jgi:hypothetical protein
MKIYIILFFLFIIFFILFYIISLNILQKIKGVLQNGYQRVLRLFQNYEYFTTPTDVSDIYVLNDPSNLPLSGYNPNYNSYYNDPSNYNIKYHNQSNFNEYESGSKGTWVKNPHENLEYIEWTDISNYSTYFIPGAYPFNPSNYVPSYEDTVYLGYNTNKKNVIYTK